MTRTLTQIALVAAFALSSAAYAQKAAETTNVPQRAGEASTMTGGSPNAKTTNSTTTAGKSSTAASSAMGNTSGKGSASATTNVPDRAGQASTMTKGVPNQKTTN